MTETLTPFNLDREASDHDLRMVNLRALVVHIADYTINELPDSPAARTLMALTEATKDVAIAAEKEAEALNVNGNTATHKLMAVPNGQWQPAPSDNWQTVRRAIATATDPVATTDDLTRVLQDVDGLASVDEDFAPELEAMIRIIELRGYGVGWLSTFNRRRPHLSQGFLADRQPRREDLAADIRASLTAEEIETAARAFSAGLNAYLIGTLSHSATEGLRVEAEETAPK